MEASDVQRHKELEEESQRLKKMFPDLSLCYFESRNRPEGGTHLRVEKG